MALLSKVRKSILYRSIRYCGKLKRVYFDASAASLKLLMDLTSSANDFCIVFGICSDLGKKKKERDNESHKFTAPVVLVPNV